VCHSSVRLADIAALSRPVSAHLIFHHADSDQVDGFVHQFGHLFASLGQRGVTAGDDFVSSPSDDVIIRSIRARYLSGVSIAIVLLGSSTWSRRFVDWEIAAAIGGPDDVSLGLIGWDLGSSEIRLPPRLGLTQPPVAAAMTDDHPGAEQRLVDAIEQVLTDPSPPVARRPLQRIDRRLSPRVSRPSGTGDMNIYDIGEMPGVGKYCCTGALCTWSVVLDDDTDRLPPCGKCGAGQDTTYEDC